MWEETIERYKYKYMLINIKTKYNIGDEVYIIHKTSMHNDWYCIETEWQVVYHDSDFYKFRTSPFKIERIVINQYLTKTRLLYEIDGYLYTEEDMFTNLEDAKKECKIRNMEY